MRTQLHFTYCHRKPERSFFWRGKQFPVCARCTGINLGYLSYPLFLFGIIHINFWIALAMLTPTIIDGLIQAFWDKESNNTRRFVTGLIAGIGSMAIVSIIGIEIGKLIVKYILN